MPSPHRLQIKLFLEDDDQSSLEPFISLFHRWIQQNELPGLLIDIHDYSHIAEGPGILLVGHEGDYALDEGEGRRGLIYRLKRGPTTSAAEAAKAALGRAVQGALLIERDDALDRRVRFSRTEFEIRILDRLNYPNDAEGLAAAESQLSPVFRSFLEGSGPSIDRIDNDAREPLVLRATTATDVDFDRLLVGVAASADVV